MQPRTLERWYHRIKWTWLLFQCAMPVLAACYVARADPALLGPPAWLPLPTLLVKVLLAVALTVYLILWLIAESVLAMARFPLDFWDAVKLVGGGLGQFIFLLATGGSVCFTAFVSLFLTLAALFGCLVLLLAAEALKRVRARRLPWRGAGAALLAILIGLVPFAVLLPLVARGYRELAGWAQAANGLLLLVQAGLVVRTLVGFSVFGRPDPRQKEYEREWERWAAPTIVLLILTTVAAGMIVGISHAEP